MWAREFSQFLPIGLACVAALGCRPAERAPAATPPKAPTSPPPGKPSVEEPEPEPTPVPPSDTPVELGYLADGSLLVVGRHSLALRTTQGISSRFDSVPEGAVVHSSPHMRGVVIETNDRITFLETPSLRQGYDGAGYALVSEPVAVIDAGRTALVQAGESVLRIPLDRGPSDGRLVSATPVAGGKRLNLTIVAEDVGSGEGEESFLVDLQGGNAVGKGLPIRPFMGAAPRVAEIGRVGFVTDHEKVSRIDLETGAVARTAKVRCGGGLELGNPTPTSDGALLLVTCGDDGVVLDGTSLRELRRIPRIIPGCDNGPFLGGVILEDGHTLHLEGCAGVAALDLTKGKFDCADDPGLLGAPYMDMLPLGAPRGPRIPRGRENVPRCTPPDQQAAVLMGASRSYSLAYGEPMRVVHGKTSFALETGAQVPVLAPDEKSIAYILDDRIVVRDLPDGRARSKWAFSEL